MHKLAFVLALPAALGADHARGAQAPSEVERLFAAIRSRDTAAVRVMLDVKPSLASARDAEGRSAVLAAIFTTNKGFIPPQNNEVLSLLVARKPELDIFEACGVNDVSRVEALLRAKPTLATAWHPVGWTPLHFAGFAGSARAIELLVANGADVHARAKTRFRNTPLQAALLTGQYEGAKTLLDRGADVLDRQAKGFAPIHEAALLGRNDLVELLLDRGAEINSRSDDGRTPLSEARRRKHAEAIALLEAKGAVAGPFTGDLMASPD